MKILIVSLLLSFSSYAKDYDYKIDGKTYEGYYLKKSSSAPMVFLIHDWDGVGEYEKKRSKMLFKLGFSVFSIDMYGKGNRPQETKKKRAMTRSLYSDRPKMRKLMNGAMKAAKRLGLNTTNAVALGYCFGGTSILEWAKSGADLKGFASFHGNLGLKEKETYKNTKSKIVVFHGTADKAVSMKEFADLAVHLEELKIPHEMITYSGAPHAFTVFGRDRYRKDADEKSWTRFTAFLNEQLY